ncbi:MAG: DUF58 domain-containing protein [Xanthomonadales bacterium]|nr:DUF58 domain-containing protein [Xanthomonadales bacterium]
MSTPAANPTRVALDELIALAPLARGARLARRRPASAAEAGGLRSRWRGRGMDFRESRIYQPGDEIRHMDWRVTARSGKAHTKLFEEEREQALLLVMDFNPSMRFGSRVRFKNVQAARAAAFLAWTAGGAGDRVGALAFGGGVAGEVKPASGRRGVLGVLRALHDWDAAAAPDRHGSLEEGLVRLRRLLRPGVRVVVVSDGFLPGADAPRRLTEIAARHELALVLPCDALELAPPPPGRYAVHLGGLRGMLDFSDRATREAWASRLAAPRAELTAHCRRLGIRVAELETQADLRPALAPLLASGRSAVRAP